MPQVDLFETLMCGGGDDCRVACETRTPPPPEDPDLPAESFRVRIGAEMDWTDLNAVFDRDDSTKGDTNPKSQHSNPKPRSNAERLSGNLKPKAPIIGLPGKGKIHRSGYLGCSARRRTSGRICSKSRGGARGVEKATVVEPASPKVSCVGKVLSERERDRCQRALPRTAPEAEEEKGRGGGCWWWSRLAAVFKCFGGGGRRAAAVENAEDSPAPPPPMLAPPPPPPRASVEAGVVGLGAMKKFASGHRPASWGADAEVDGHVALSRRED